MGRTENEEGYGRLNRFLTKPVVVLLSTTIIGPIIAGFVVNAVTKDKTYEAVQKATVEMLSAKLDYIKETDNLDDAIDKIEKTENELNEIKEKSEESSKDNVEKIKDLEAQLDAANNKVEFLTPSVKKSGESIQNVEDSLLIYDGNRRFVSTDLLSKVYSNDEFVDNGNELVFNFTMDDIGEMLKDKGVPLTQMEVNQGGNDISISAMKDKNNNPFENCIYPSRYADEGFIEYTLDKKYKWFKCAFFVPKEAASVSEDDWRAASVMITGKTEDGESHLITKHAVSKREDPRVESELCDISGCQYLQIQFSNGTVGEAPLLCIENPMLYINNE